jgi:hypothetical protein
MTRRKLFHAATGNSLAHALLAGGQQTSGRRLTPADSLPEADKNRKLKVVFIGAHVRAGHSPSDAAGHNSRTRIDGRDALRAPSVSSQKHGPAEGQPGVESRPSSILGPDAIT